MFIDEPEVKPKCCDQESKYVCLSPKLAYLYCTACKKEVLPKAASYTVGVDWADHGRTIVDAVNFKYSIVSGVFDPTLHGRVIDGAGYPGSGAQVVRKFQFGDVVLVPLAFGGQAEGTFFLLSCFWNPC